MSDQMGALIVLVALLFAALLAIIFWEFVIVDAVCNFNENAIVC